MIESHDTEQDLKGSGPEHKVGLSRKVKEQHKSNRNNREGQDSDQYLDWKSMEGQDSEEKPKEGYG